MKGNSIIVCAGEGRHVEGILTAITPLPGTVLQIDASAGLDSNENFTFELYNADADGGRPKGPIFILKEDPLQGKTVSDAYVASSRCFCYVPLPGDELNLLLGDVAGTGDDHLKGEMLMVDDTTGEFVATTGSPESEPAMLLEDVTDPVADTLVHCIWTGY